MSVFRVYIEVNECSIAIGDAAFFAFQKTTQEEEQMIVGVDHGNSFMKTQGFTFPAGLTVRETKPPAAMVREFIEYEGKYYIPTGSARLAYARDKTKNDDYFILTLFAIMKELCRTKTLDQLANTHTSITLSIGLPPLHYDQLKEKWEQYFLRKGVKFKYNDVPVAVSIDKVYVFVQGFAGAVLYGVDKLAEYSEICIVDIGGYTTDVLVLNIDEEGIRIDMEHFMSIEEGVIKLTDKASDEISAKFDLLIKESLFEKVFKGEKTFLSDEVIEFIHQSVDAQAAKILNIIRQKGIDLKTMPALFIGGGGAVFKRSLQNSDMVAKPIFLDDQRANAIGYYKLAKAAKKSR